MTTVRTEPRHYGTSRRNNPRHCAFDGCFESTREGKPYCSEHVERHDYVQSILATLMMQESEQERAIKRGGKRHIKDDSLTVKEMVNYLRIHGDRTIPRLCRDLQMDESIVKVYGEHLVERGICSMRTTVRGTPVLSIKV